MLDRQLFNFLLQKANAEAEDNVKFKGNYALIRLGDIPVMMELDSNTQYTYSLKTFVPMAETVGTEVSFVEEHNRSDWVKQYAFKFRGREKDRVIQSLQNLRDYLFLNPVQTINDDGTDYKFRFKCSRPIFAGSFQAQAGDVELIYNIQISATSIEKGFFNDEVTYKLGAVGSSLEDVILDSGTSANNTPLDVSNDITTTNNAKGVPIARTVQETFEMVYNGTVRDKLIYSILKGVTSRETKFNLQEVFDGVTFNSVVTITQASRVRKKGTVVTMLLVFNEVS